MYSLGMKRKPGPKIEPLIEGLSARTFTLDEVTLRMLETLGEGNMSRGIRVAARWAYDSYQRGHLIRGMKNAVPVAPSAPDGLPPA
jgi:hypothetical protein